MCASIWYLMTPTDCAMLSCSLASDALALEFLHQDFLAANGPVSFFQIGWQALQPIGRSGIFVVGRAVGPNAVLSAAIPARHARDLRATRSRGGAE